MVDSARELGGVVSFVKSTRNKAMQLRCEGLTPLFSRLARSRGPLSLRVAALPLKLWSRALHAVMGCPVSDAQINRLRAQAVRALRLASSGASAALRLLLLGPMEADPGFFQVWQTLSTFRRLARKQSALVSSWRLFMAGFAGDLHHGPFSKLLQMMHQLRWTLTHPPFFLDAEGLEHNLLLLPDALLRQLAEDSWAAHVGSQHVHRKTMPDIKGIDLDVVRHARQGLAPVDCARQSALQSGALMFGHLQAKFDASKSGLCSRCQVPDTAEHRVRFCSMYAEARRERVWVCNAWPHLPVCLTHHLIPPANPYLPGLRAYLHGLPGLQQCITDHKPSLGRQHMFTDGSCVFSGHSTMALASWAVVSATDGCVIAAGHLQGQQQTVPRAEATAVLAAMVWGRRHQVALGIWSDAKHVVDEVNRLQQGGCVAAGHENFDLWTMIAELVFSFSEDELWVRHVPSHLAEARCESPLEDWLCQWNNHADLVAGQLNQCRPLAITELHAKAQAHHEYTVQVVQALQAIYFDIAAQDQRSSRVGHALEELPDMERMLPPGLGTPRGEFMEELLPIAWRQHLSTGRSQFPVEFKRDVVQFLLKQDSSSELAQPITWLELVVMMVLEGAVCFPVQGQRDRWVAHFEATFRQSLTLTVQLRLFRRAAIEVLRSFGLQSLLREHLSLAPLGFALRLDGIVIGADSGLRFKARESLVHFAGGRTISAAAGLSRPLAAR